MSQLWVVLIQYHMFSKKKVHDIALAFKSSPSEDVGCHIYIVYTAQAVVAEADLRVVEMKKAAYEFDRDIVRGAVNPVSQNTPVYLHNYIYSTFST